MKKAQVLILLILIALVVYYFSQTTPKPTASLPPKTPPLLTKKMPVLNGSLNQKTIGETKPTVIMPSKNIEKKPAGKVFVSEDKVELNNSPKSPVANDYYRREIVNLLEDWLASLSNLPQKSKVTEAISLFQSENKERWEYLQAVWSLRGMEGFEFYVGESFREWVNLPVKAQPTEFFDTGWLTDDNLEFILRNSLQIQGALKQKNQAGKVFHLRTDLANVYNCYYKAKSKQDWPLPEFLAELEFSKAKYVLLPCRVNGNHWGLVVLEDLAWKEAESAYQVWYTSAGEGDLEEEKKQMGYDCGVYLVKYVEEVLENGALGLKRKYSREECQEFRWEWKEKIGEGWCRWD